MRHPFDAIPILAPLGGHFIYQPDEPLTREQYEQLSRALEPMRLEIDENHQIVIMSPVNYRYSHINSILNMLVAQWAEQEGNGIHFESSGGFDLPNGSNRSPDAAWVLRSRIQALPDNQREPFPKLAPDFVAELRSPSDRLPALQAKMQMWLDNGVRLGWLIDPSEEKAYVYLPNQSVVEVPDFERSLSGQDVLPGFELPLAKLRLPKL